MYPSNSPWSTVSTCHPSRVQQSHAPRRPAQTLTYARREEEEEEQHGLSGSTGLTAALIWSIQSAPNMVFSLRRTSHQPLRRGTSSVATHQRMERREDRRSSSSSATLDSPSMGGSVPQEDFAVPAGCCNARLLDGVPRNVNRHALVAAQCLHHPGPVPLPHPQLATVRSGARSRERARGRHARAPVHRRRQTRRTSCRATRRCRTRDPR